MEGRNDGRGPEASVCSLALFHHSPSSWKSLPLGFRACCLGLLSLLGPPEDRIEELPEMGWGGVGTQWESDLEGSRVVSNPPLSGSFWKLSVFHRRNLAHVPDAQSIVMLTRSGSYPALAQYQLLGAPGRHGRYQHPPWDK